MEVTESMPDSMVYFGRKPLNDEWRQKLLKLKVGQVLTINKKEWEKWGYTFGRRGIALMVSFHQFTKLNTDFLIQTRTSRCGTKVSAKRIK